jgi:hypothetical protein
MYLNIIKNVHGNSIFMQHKPENKHALTASYVGERTGWTQIYQKNDISIHSDMVHVTRYVWESDETTSKHPRAVGPNKNNSVV